MWELELGGPLLRIALYVGGLKKNQCFFLLKFLVDFNVKLLPSHNIIVLPSFNGRPSISVPPHPIDLLRSLAEVRYKTEEQKTETLDGKFFGHESQDFDFNLKDDGLI